MTKTVKSRTILTLAFAVVICTGGPKVYRAYERRLYDAEWYLLAPSVEDIKTLGANLEAPLDQWSIEETFTSKTACEEALAAKRDANRSDRELSPFSDGRCLRADASGIPKSDGWRESHPDYLTDRDEAPTTIVGRTLNAVALDSRLHPEMSLPERIFEFWFSLAFYIVVVFSVLQVIANLFELRNGNRRP